MTSPCRRFRRGRCGRLWPQKTMAPYGAIERRSGRPWGRRAYSALRTPALASRPVQDLPASPLHFMAAPVPTQVPLCNLRTAWLLRRGTWKLSLESAPGTIPYSWRVCTEMRVSAASCLPQGSRLFKPPLAPNFAFHVPEFGHCRDVCTKASTHTRCSTTS